LPQPPLSHVDHDPERFVPRISFSALQHFRIREPFFSLPLLWQRRRNVALILRSLTLGFGYPLNEMVWFSHPWESLSVPNALGLRSSELCSFQVIEKPFQILLSTLALSGKTLPTLPRRSSDLLPPRKPSPFVPPKCLAWVGSYCSLEPFDLSGFPSVGPYVWGISTRTFPSHTYEFSTLRLRTQ
jgi:hypothetical protein